MGSAGIALQDLGGSLYRLPLAARLALDDIHGKYRRTVLGPLWIAIGQAVTVGGFVLVFSGLFGLDPTHYTVYLAAGFPVWALLSQFLVDMPQTFIAARGVIESYQLPWLMHIWRRSIGYQLTLLHQLATLVVVMVMLRIPPKLEMLLALPALAIIVVAGTGVGTLLAVLGARYRDLQPAMQVATGFLFLFTPVMWRADQLREQLTWVFQYNPLYYFVRLLRDPLMGSAPPAEIWLGASAGAIALFGIGFLAFLLARRRLYHWL